MSSPEEWTPRVRRVSADSNDRFQHISSLISEEKFDDARDELLLILRDDEKSTQGRIMLGVVYLHQQIYSDALDQFNNVIAIDPLIGQAHLLAGYCCLRMKDFAAAQPALQMALELDPKKANAHAGMAQVLAQTGQPERAIPYLEEALRLDPQMTSARMLMARLLSQAGNIDGAIEELTSLVHADPDHTGASLQLAMMQRQKGNHEEAVELLEAAAKAKPESAKIWDLLGRMKKAVKDYEGAERAFAEAIELKTTDRATQLRLIDAQIKQGKLEQAREALQKLPRRGPMKSVVHRFYGDIYLAKQLYDEAVESYRAAILHMPDGDAVIAEIEAAAGPGANSEAQIPHFEAAFTRLREERRKAEQEGRSGGPGVLEVPASVQAVRGPRVVNLPA